MNQTPPPLENPNQMNQSPAQSSGGGGKCAAGCGIGCLIVVALCVALGIGGYFWAKGKVEEAVDLFTSDTAEEIVAPKAPKLQVEQVLARFDQFADEMEAGNVSEPLILTGEELNLLLHNHENFSDFAGMAAVEIDEDVLKARVSIDLESLEVPINFIAEQFEGRYFNGTGGFSLNMNRGRLALYLEELEVNGMKVPEIYIQEMSEENLFKDLQNTPEIDSFFSKLSDLKVEDGKMIIVPK